MLKAQEFCLCEENIRLKRNGWGRLNKTYMQKNLRWRLNLFWFAALRPTDNYPHNNYFDRWLNLPIEFFCFLNMTVNVCIECTFSNCSHKNHRNCPVYKCMHTMILIKHLVVDHKTRCIRNWMIDWVNKSIICANWHDNWYYSMSYYCFHICPLCQTFASLYLSCSLCIRVYPFEL